MTWENGVKVKICKYCGEEGHTPFQCKKRAFDKKKEQDLNKHFESNEVQEKEIQIKPKKEKTRKDIVLEFDKVFSQYIRMKELLKNNGKYVYCLTCHKRLKYEESMACHFINRRFISTRFDEDNVYCGCFECNNTNYAQAMERYREIIGQSKVDELNEKSHQVVSTPELKENFSLYKKKLKALKAVLFL